MPSKIIVEESKGILPEFGWPVVRTVKTKVFQPPGKLHRSFGYYLKSPVPDLRDIYLGALDYKELQGVFVGVIPLSLDIFEKFINNGFVFLSRIPRSRGGTLYKHAGWSDQWFYKKIISPKIIRVLSKMDKKDRAEALKDIYKSTLPFSLTAE